jgi:NADH:ubiquinone oxidoreductase subunit 4 (subunit M)
MILFNRIAFGTLKEDYITNNYTDLLKIEYFILLLLLIMMIILGLFPNLFLSSVDLCITNLYFDLKMCQVAMNYYYLPLPQIS